MKKLLVLISIQSLIFVSISSIDNREQFRQEVSQIREDVKNRVKTHPGTTFDYIDCQQFRDETSRKVVSFLKSQQSNMVEDYFKSRCDFQIEYLVQILPNLKIQQAQYFQSVYFFNPASVQRQVYENFIEGRQIYNSIPYFLESLSHQDLLRETLLKFDLKKRFSFDSSSFQLQTYIFNIAQSSFTEEEQIYFQQITGGHWIVKDSNLQGVNRTLLFRGNQDLKNKIREKKSAQGKEKMKTAWGSSHQTVLKVQRYLETPLLINKHKVQQKRIILIPSVKPFVILSQTGSSSISEYQYDLEYTVFDDQQSAKHFINQNKYNKNLKEIENLHLNPDQFFSYLENSLGLSKKQIDNINYEVNQVIVYSILAGKDQLIKKTGFFQVLSADFLFGQNLSPWLLEINALSNFSRMDTQMVSLYPEIIQTTYDLILQSHQHPEQLIEIWSQPQKYLDLGSFEVIYNEATGYNILDQYITNKPKNSKTDL